MGFFIGIVSFFKTIWRVILVSRLLWRAHSSSQVPGWLKTILPLGLLYVIFPLDFLPDFIPLLGQLDDASLLALLAYVVYQLLPKAFLAAEGWVRNRQRRGKDIIEGEYREVSE
jgi:uncharacterized membrane protein YkvA (DUF1232 family)